MASQIVNKSFKFHKQFFVFSVLLRGLCCATERTHSGHTLFATKTAYENSFTPPELEIILNPSSVYVPPSCKPIHVSGLYRHGSRFPGIKDIKNGHTVAEKIRNKISNDFSFLNSWEPMFPLDRAKVLSESGMVEMKRIGERIGLRYRELFVGADQSELYFQVTSRSRARDSADNFLVGVNDVLQSDIATSFIVKDDLLRYYDNCTEFTKNVENNYEALKEFYSFAKGPEVRNVHNKVVKRLGLSEGDLNLVDVKTLYSIAAFEIATFGSTDLDKIFDKNDLRVLEYTADLKNYWRKGHGYTINWEQACPLLTDIFTIMASAKENYKTNDLYTKVALRFAHAETLMPLICLLGLGKEEEPPRADNFQFVKDKQKFRGGRFAPFAGNVHFALYHCSEENRQREPLDTEQVPPGVTFPEQLDEYMVQLLVNELPVKFPMCEHHLCPYSLVKEHYSKYVGCKFENVCKLEKHRSLHDEL